VSAGRSVGAGKEKGPQERAKFFVSLKIWKPNLPFQQGKGNSIILFRQDY
jgi:hypothetical protein